MHIMRCWMLFQDSNDIYLLCFFSSPGYMHLAVVEDEYWTRWIFGLIQSSRS